jgi:hypothetical protein
MPRLNSGPRLGDQPVESLVIGTLPGHDAGSTAHLPDALIRDGATRANLSSCSPSPDVTVRCLAGHAMPQRLVVVRLSTLNSGPAVGRGCLLGLGGRRITTGGLGPVAQLPETVFHRLHYLHALGMRPLVLDQGLQGLRVDGSDAMDQAALG